MAPSGFFLVNLWVRSELDGVIGLFGKAVETAREEILRQKAEMETTKVRNNNRPIEHSIVCADNFDDTDVGGLLSV